MTLRVIETLQSVDLIAAEDTRNTIKLLNHFEIDTPMTSYHEHNKTEKAAFLTEQLLSGKNVALVTDAGTPVISDPGDVLVSECRKAGIPVTSLPGPCACITALTLSGLPARRFCFEGFLPADKKERAAVLAELKAETRTIVLYEAPHHLAGTLGELLECLGDRPVTICRELTKKFETITPTSLQEAYTSAAETPPRGEYVLVLAGRDKNKALAAERADWENMSIEDHVAFYEREGWERKEAMRQAAKDRGVSKREIYEFFLHK